MIQGKILNQLRTAKDVSLNQISKETGINYSVLHNIESGRTKRMNAATISKLAKYFKVNEDYIRTGKYDPVANVEIDMESASQRLGTVIALKNLPLQILADGIGMTKLALQRFVDGETEMRPNNLQKAAAHLGVSYKWIAT